MKEKCNWGTKNKHYAYQKTPQFKKFTIHGMLLWLVVLLTIMSEHLQAAEPVLVKNINTSTNTKPFDPQHLTTFKGALYFSAVHPTKGRELWKSDGTTAGTVLLKDINTAGDSSPDLFIEFKNELYFVADNSTHGRELWKTNGSAAGTVRITNLADDIATDRELFQPHRNVEISRRLGVHLGKLYFTTRKVDPLNNDLTTESLWKSDGTAAGTQLVKTGLRLVNNYFSANGTLYFSAYDDAHGLELWKSNGTATGTKMVKDISPGPSDSYQIYRGAYEDYGNSIPKNFFTYNGKVYFIANNSFYNPETNDVPYLSEGLWQTDGTEAGTSIVFETAKSAAPTADGIIVSGRDPYYDDGIWLINDTGAVIQEILAKRAYDSPYHTRAVHVNFGQYTETTPAFPVYYEIPEHPVIDEPTYPVAQLRMTSSNHENSELVTNKFSLYHNYILIDNNLFFANNVHQAPGDESAKLLKYNLLNKTTRQIKQFPMPINTNYFPLDDSEEFISFNESLFFTSKGDDGQRSLWRSDGTELGTYIIKRNTMNNSLPQNFMSIGNTTYFTAEDATHGRELWKSDGTSAGTVMVKDIKPGIESSNISMLTTINDIIYFSAKDGSNGVELWKSDGTTTGTILVKNINTATVTSANPSADGHSNPRLLTVLNGVLYFSARDGVNGYELWRSDGTEIGTQLVKNINPATVISSDPDADGHSNPKYLATINNVIYFSARDGVNGYELWKSNGTANGTVMVKNINTTTVTSSDPMSSGHSNPAFLATLDGKLYFNARDGKNGIELWRTDGTAAGTIMVKNINPAIVTGSDPLNDDGHSNPKLLATHNGVLYFSANDGSHGVELWKTNGTMSGTIMVDDYDTGSVSGPDAMYDVVGHSNPQYIGVLNNELYFSASYRDVSNPYSYYGRIIYKINTANDKPILLSDRIGLDSTVPLSTLNGKLFFSTVYPYSNFNSFYNGYDIWQTDGTQEGTKLIANIESNLTDGAKDKVVYDDQFLYYNNLNYEDIFNYRDLLLMKADGVDTYPLIQTIELQATNGEPFGTLRPYHAVNGLFSGKTATEGTELWRLP